jgi:hypothetical protein
MSKIKDTFFGGAERRAGQMSAAGIERGQDILREAQERAEGQAIPLFEAAQGNALAGSQGALNIFGRVAPEQINAAQGGNMTAQETLLAGLPQFQNAILGGNVDLSGLQAQQQQAPSADFFQQQLPEFTSINQALNPPPVTPPQFTGGGCGGIGGFGGSGNFGGFQNNQFPTGFQMPSNLINPGFPQQPQQPTTGVPGGLLGGIF